MANESAPANPLPADYVPDGAVDKHRVADGEDWASVAKDYGVDVNALIYFNFHTNVPEEVNWYLRRNVGCNVSNDGDVNWAFSSSADPGIIYIPPAQVINMDPENITGSGETLLQRLQRIAKTIGGAAGARIVKMVDLAAQSSPNEDHLWYYNPQVAWHYIQLQTANSERQDMTKATNGQLPFDGDSGTFGNWKIFPFKEIIDLDTANRQLDSDLKSILIDLDNKIFSSWQGMIQIHDVGGGTTEGLVADFLDHVHDLADQPIHLYYFYQHDN